MFPPDNDRDSAAEVMVDIQVSATQMEKKKSYFLAGRSIFGISEVGKSSISNSQANRVLEKPGFL